MGKRGPAPVTLETVRFVAPPKIRVVGVVPPLTTSDEEEVEALWVDAVARSGGRLFNGRVCSVRHFEKGAIEVEIVRSDDEVTVSVSDKGIGIDPSELDGIFERFRRGGNAAQMNEEGLGLGLPVAKAIVDAHEGKIEMRSKVGEGTTVLVTLPADTKGEQA